MTDFFDKPAWINRTLFYATIFVTIALIFIIIFGIFNLIFPNFIFPNNAIDYDNERYLLSALVQSLAATIALVITLSLVAVQLAAQSYSARVIDVYKRNPDMWILLCIYIFTIFYGLGLTKIIGLGILGNYMEGAIFVAYFMGFFAFLCLVPYVWNIIELIKPSHLMNLLAMDITKENVLKAVNNDTKTSPEVPIIDVINIALERSDPFTVRDGLEAITNSVKNVFQNEHFKEEEEKLFSKYILSQLKLIGLQAVSRKNDVSAKNTVKNICSIFIKTSKMKKEHTHFIATSCIGEIGIEASKQELYVTTTIVAKLFGIIGVYSIENSFTDITRLVIKDLAEIAINGDKITKSEVTEAMGKMGIKSMEMKIQNPIIRNNVKTIIDTLYEIGILEEDIWTASKISEYLEEIGTKSIIRKSNDIQQVTLDVLLEMGNHYAENELEINIWVVKEALQKIGLVAIESENKEATKMVIEVLGEIGITAAKMKLPWEPEVEGKRIKSTSSSISRRELEKLSNKSKENKWEDITSLIESKIQEIEKTRNNNGN
ncbi:DUF2254 family protein [Methanolobus sp.]|uniref:DUF2254 family protein n=1 Tax=Methanolobus sp. TaxID=1874737 RepID=UPI00258DEBB9|nr:DUF2254 family protein [Methanolobus sp.]